MMPINILCYRKHNGPSLFCRRKIMRRGVNWYDISLKLRVNALQYFVFASRLWRDIEIAQSSQLLRAFRFLRFEKDVYLDHNHDTKTGCALSHKCGRLGDFIRKFIKQQDWQCASEGNFRRWSVYTTSLPSTLFLCSSWLDLQSFFQLTFLDNCAWVPCQSEKGSVFFKPWIYNRKFVPRSKICHKERSQAHAGFGIFNLT